MVAKLLVDLTLETLAEHPASLRQQELRGRLSVVRGDGQIVSGGPLHRHNSSMAAETLWKTLHPSASLEAGGSIVCVQWDNFHRSDIGAVRAIRSVPAAQEVLDVAATLDHLFGVGEGRVLLRGIADLLGERTSHVQGPGGTRKIVHLSTIPGNILHNYKAFVGGIHGRIGWRQAGHGRQTVESLIGLGRRLCSVPFVTFACIFSDILSRVVRPYALLVQGLVEPWVVQRAEASMLAKLVQVEGHLYTIRRHIDVLALCAQHLHPHEFRPYLVALRDTPACRAFPTLSMALADLLCHAPPPPFVGACCKPVMPTALRQSLAMAPIANALRGRQWCRPGRIVEWWYHSGDSVRKSEFLFGWPLARPLTPLPPLAFLASGCGHLASARPQVLTRLVLFDGVCNVVELVALATNGGGVLVLVAGFPAATCQSCFTIATRT